MKNKKQAGNSIQRLFSHPDNRYNFELFYKYLSQTQVHGGFVLCKGMPAERNRILTFFQHDSLMGRIHLIDMVNPLIDTIGLQEAIAAAHEKRGDKKDIFFIYNIEDCIEQLKAGEKDFFERLNLIRDFFMRYSSVFVFFMTEWLGKEMIRHAFDFYDWIKLTFSFIPEEEEKKLLQAIPGIETQKYSDPQEKIKYLQTKIEKIKDKQRRLPLLRDIGTLYYQIGDYNLALKYTIEAVDILEMSPDKQTDDLAAAYNKISQIYLAMGQLDQALEFQLKALKIRKSVLDPNHPDLAQSYNNGAMIYRAMGQQARALKFLLKALKILESVLAPNHPDLAVPYHNLSTFCNDMKNYPAALGYAEKAVAIMQKIFPNGHPILDIMKENRDRIKTLV
ncbi:MAG TPA: tetratricopeptide repeat protein [Candidatus Kapabacteria bacterium]|nr:tetratricopeptide repeat protein [Candidatus Kapabacteria bacterium]